jgi:hypothetical protein
LKRSPFVALLAAAVFAACGRREATIPREKFVAANVALRMINDSGPHADTLRAAVLKRYRVSAGDLRKFVRVNGNRTSVLAKAWDEIDDSVQKRAAPPTTPNPEPAQPVSKPGAPQGAATSRVHYPPAELRVERPVRGAARSEVPLGTPAPPPLPPPSGPPPVQTRSRAEGRPLPARSRVVPKAGAPRTAPAESVSYRR